MSELCQGPARDGAVQTAPVLTPHPLYACLHAVSPVQPGTLGELARDFSPRFECHRDDLVSIDIRGLDRLLGDPHAIGAELRRSAAARGLRLQVAIAATRTAAMVLARARPGLTVVERGHDAEALAPIPIEILEKITDQPPSAQRTHRRSPIARSAIGGSAVSAISAVKRWGIRTLGALAALPAAELAARLGPHGLVWQAMARGQDVRPLVPTLPEERFESSTELDWPIEGLEPLSFVLTRLLEPLSTRLERRDRGAAAVHVTLELVKGYDDDDQRGDRGDNSQHVAQGFSPAAERKAEALRYAPVENSVSSAASASNVVAGTYTRTLELPAPLRDVRALRTLILLDLESHPPPAAVERVTVVIDPTPGRVLQHTLFTRAHPTPEQLATLIARLTALMGQDRIGRPAVVDSYRPGAFAMQPFATEHDGAGGAGKAGKAGGAGGAGEENKTNPAHPAYLSHPAYPPHDVVSALRRCRHPVPARVAVANGRPVAVTTDRRGFTGGRVQRCTGPWRTSGEWWAGQSDRPGEAGRAGRENNTHPPNQPHLPQTAWNRDEWDVWLSDGVVYRIFRDRVTDGWFIDAIAD